MNRDLGYYLTLPYRMEIVPDPEEGGYVISYPELPGCLTCADTMEQALLNAQDAKVSWIEAALEQHRTIPEPDALHDYSGQFKLRIPKSLHRDLVMHSREEGISMNQYCLYLLSMNDARASQPLTSARG